MSMDYEDHLENLRKLYYEAYPGAAPPYREAENRESRARAQSGCYLCFRYRRIPQIACDLGKKQSAEGLPRRRTKSTNTGVFRNFLPSTYSNDGLKLRTSFRMIHIRWLVTLSSTVICLLMSALTWVKIGIQRLLMHARYFLGAWRSMRALETHNKRCSRQDKPETRE